MDQTRVSAKEVMAICHAELARVGAKVSYGTPLFRIDIDNLAWVGLNRGVHNDFIRINPNIGVHCQPIQRLVCELSLERYQEGRFATVSFALGVATPAGTPEFIFRTLEDLRPEAERLASLLVDHGLPYLKQFVGYESLMSEIREFIPNLGGYPEKYAALMYLSGRPQAETRAFANAQKTKFIELGLADEAVFFERLLKKMALQNKQA